MTAGDCLFCRIVGGQTPSHTVFSDDDFVAFLDIRPLFEGHTLLVPRAHHEAIWDLPDDLAAKLTARTQLLSVAVKEAFDAQGVFNAVNNIVSQSVPHLHVHIVPRNRKDGLRGFFWPRAKYASESDAAAAAERIRSRLPAT